MLDKHQDASSTASDEEPQILHSAKSPVPSDQLSGDSVEERIAEVLDQIAAGLRADDELESVRLTLARKIGSLVLELKRIVPFGKYMDKLKERFPTSSYHKCHRCRFLAEHDAEIEAALSAYPEVTWGPTKMSNYLKGKWSPETGAGQSEEADTEDQPVVDTVPFPVNEEVSDLAEEDDAGEKDESDTEDVQEQDGQAKPASSEKKFETLMGRFEPGGDMHKVGKSAKKTAQATGFRVTVVTPEGSDLEKFGTLLPSPIIDFKAHSVSGWVRSQDIASTLASVGSTLTTANLKKIRVVVEL